jgi:hypothetical protein
MTAVLTALLLAVMPASLDLPPEIDVAAVASAVAVRLDPPPPTVEDVAPDSVPSPGSSASAGGRCVGWEPLLDRLSPGWSTERMSRIMYRESRCQPTVRNRSSSATGLLQLLASHCPWLARQMGTWCTRDRLTDPTFNVAAAAVLWAEQGYSAWSTS